MYCINAGIIDKIRIGIKKQNKPSLRGPDPLVVRFCKAVVRVGSDEPDIVHAGLKVPERVLGPVGGIVVDNDGFERDFPVKIAKKAFKTFECQGFRVIADNYD
jgi:hypothetical protein